MTCSQLILFIFNQVSLVSPSINDIIILIQAYCLKENTTKVFIENSVEVIKTCFSHREQNRASFLFGYKEGGTHIDGKAADTSHWETLLQGSQYN